MNDSGLAYKVDALFGCAGDLHLRGILQVVHTGGCPIEWDTSIYSIGLGSQV